MQRDNTGVPGKISFRQNSSQLSFPPTVCLLVKSDVTSFFHAEPMGTGDAPAVRRSGPISEQRGGNTAGPEEDLTTVRAPCAEEDGQIEARRGFKKRKGSQLRSEENSVNLPEKVRFCQRVCFWEKT